MGYKDDCVRASLCMYWPSWTKGVGLIGRGKSQYLDRKAVERKGERD